ncbi:DUF4190 domain-containing protein [Gordonia sputi]
MRTEHHTAPIEPAITDRHERWPQSNVLESMSLPSLPDSPSSSHTPDSHSGPVTTAGRGDHAQRPQRNPVPMEGLRVRTRDTSRDTPLPEVGDYWDLSHRENAILMPTVIPTVHPVSLVGQVPAQPRTSPLTTASLVTALAAFPLIPVLGIGGVAGLMSIALGAAGVRQIHRHPTRYRGSGRAVTGIILGTIAAVIGIPILLLVLVIAGL